MDGSTADIPKGSLLAFLPESKIAALVQAMSSQNPACGLAYEGPNRRASLRVAVTVDAAVQPLDKSFMPVGEAFTVVTRDISTWGVGLVSTRPIHAPFLALRVPGTDPDALWWIVRVLRCQHLGEFHDVGGSFVTSSKEMVEK